MSMHEARRGVSATLEPAGPYEPSQHGRNDGRVCTMPQIPPLFSAFAYKWPSSVTSDNADSLCMLMLMAWVKFAKLELENRAQRANRRLQCGDGVHATLLARLRSCELF